MFYRSDQFWNEKGADFVYSYLKLVNISSSKDEIYELIVEKEYLDKEVAKDFEPEVINYIKAWDTVREIILKIKEFEKKYQKRVDTLILDEFTILYESVHPERTYIDMFKGETKESKSFLSKLERIIVKMTKVETFDSLVEYLLAAAYDLTANDFLGKITFRYLIWLVETVMISRGYGVAIFEDQHEIKRLFYLHENIIQFVKENNSKNFSLCKEFRELVSIFKDKIEFFSNHEKKKYIFE
ncbi:hypothetical protein [Spiroplasma floricola]|uniref:Uncharacterized protein n=1 Tax=Spiroplasma floricola 23-6 TaxID=1336749 RepID=A0A2K8SEK6_9MOLU|nr:hypothetical protein [Spiroplasma floricola]AUB31833.1 hypothetical protein SFLOR_v1c07850 [Spiroplasma floricola 23-6]